MRKFSEKYIVDEKYIKEYLVHLEQLKLEREKRRENVQKARGTEAERGYEEHNWVEFLENGELKNKTNKILQKYMGHHKLGSFKTKRERIASIVAHISRQLPSPYQTTLAPNREKKRKILTLVISLIQKVTPTTAVKCQVIHQIQMKHCLMLRVTMMMMM